MAGRRRPFFSGVRLKKKMHFEKIKINSETFIRVQCVTFYKIGKVGDCCRSKRFSEIVVIIRLN